VLHKCANPACPSLFRSLNLGKLFLLDTDSSVAGASGTSPANRRGRSVRPGCSSLLTLLTLTFERGRGMVTVPLPSRNTPCPALHLSQIQSTVKMYRAELKGAL